MSLVNYSDPTPYPILDSLSPSQVYQHFEETTIVDHYSTSADKEDLSELGYSIAAVCLFLIMVFGCFNNFVVIVVVAGTKKLRTPMNVILLNLSISDFIISLFGTPMSFASAINRNWIFGPFLCEVYAFCMTLTGEWEF
ncbi:g_PROTEIN_RECEP_F1_2 domain-containing protein [Trichonephila inaurata madagascariensis]|uniref:G_PROTEIN_RECEP_F1_2 domain-containing protein n=1 Tax=Trichonephila inaurata madagascariensis TaxID=2747483 RepID=A0A8X6M8P9_9ARAC|nr:g_PROTEIN_RECEP_F1_2 domain-containing protein [Trichonephila inaurata madagascariensis]